MVTPHAAAGPLAASPLPCPYTKPDSHARRPSALVSKVERSASTYLRCRNSLTAYTAPPRAGRARAQRCQPACAPACAWSTGTGCTWDWPQAWAWCPSCTCAPSCMSASWLPACTRRIGQWRATSCRLVVTYRPACSVLRSGASSECAPHCMGASWQPNPQGRGRVGSCVLEHLLPAEVFNASCECAPCCTEANWLPAAPEAMDSGRPPVMQVGQWVFVQW